MLSRLFKPKWQHAKSTVRLSAISEMLGSNPEQHAILAELARHDPDDNVRGVAAAKLFDVPLLRELAQTLPAARTRLTELLTGQVPNGPTLEQRLECLSHIHDPTILHNVLDHGDQALHESVITQFQAQSDLADIAIRHPRAKVRLAAAQRVTETQHLERILRHSKNKDKGLYQLARAKLSQLRTDVRETRQQRQQQLDITESMETLAKSDFSPLFSPRMKGLLLQWRQLDIAPDHDLAQRFELAQRACNETLEHHHAAVAEQHEHSQATRQIDQCCARLEAQIALLNKGSTLEIDTVERLLSEQQAQWQAATALATPTEYDQQRFKQAWLTLSAYQEGVQTLQRHQPRLAALNARVRQLNVPDHNKRIVDTKKRLRRLLDDIHWPLQFRSPDLLIQAHHSLEQLAQLERQIADWQGQQLPQLKQQLDELEKAISDGSLKHAERRLSSAQQLLKQLPEKRTGGLAKRLAHLKARVAELRDWRGFAATQQKEVLCQRMEALTDNNMDPAYKADLIKQLQEQWKNLGYGDPSQADALWQRFKNASDQAYAPCRDYFSQQRDNRKHNLAERERICDQLEHYLHRPDWSGVDWHKHQDIMRTARQEWNRHTPVERKPGKVIQQRFEGLMSELHSKLREEQRRNLEQKRVLVRQAEALVEQEDLTAAIDTVKQLQAAWKQIGLTPQNEDRRVWKTFRAACDALFARRDQQRQLRNDQQQQDKSQAETLCEQVERYAALPDAELTAKQTQVTSAIEAFDALGSLPKAIGSNIRRRFDRAVSHFEHAVAGIPQRQLIAQIDEMMRKAEVCETMEAWVHNDAETGRQNTQAIAAQWPSQANLGNELEQRLQHRFDLAPQSIDADDAAQLTSHWADNLNTRELLCIRMEILAGLESPPEARETRMNYQLSKLNEAMVEGETDRQTQLHQAKALVEQWVATGATPPNTLAPLSRRFNGALAAIVKHPQPAVANAN